MSHSAGENKLSKQTLPAQSPLVTFVAGVQKWTRLQSEGVGVGVVEVIHSDKAHCYLVYWCLDNALVNSLKRIGLCITCSTYGSYFHYWKNTS